MAKVRLIAGEPRIVPWLGQNRTVQPDEVVEIPDGHFEAYVCQPSVWQPVEEPKKPRKTSSKTTGGKSAPAEQEGDV